MGILAQQAQRIGLGRSRKSATGKDVDYEVIVVGAGFSGIGAGIALKKAGINSFVILEKAHDLGGTWRDNTYPGIAVDITSLTYSFSFEQNPRWSRLFAPGAELQAYANHCTDKYKLRSHMRFNTTVKRAVFDQKKHRWHMELEDGNSLSARFVINATGGLTQPKKPDIKGIDSFEGKMVHTARWDHSYDLRGKRVAVIGTGATSVQLVPAIADKVEHMDVYQRTPIWLLSKPDYAMPDALKTAFQYVPGAQTGVRLLTTAATEVVMVLGVVYNKQVPGLVKAGERACLRNLEKQVPNDPELRRKLTPSYGFGCKRPSFSNEYFKTFTREDVDLVTEPIREITKDAIITADGQERKIDTLILATGFKVFEKGNLPPYEIYGVGGTELGKFWEDNRFQAYEGATVPKFPNYFAVLGPYSTSGASWFAMVECQTRHALRCIKEARRRQATYVEVKQKPHDDYFKEIQRRQQNTVFFNNNCGAANSYYFDQHGDAPFLRPSSGFEMWLHSHTFPLGHYRFKKPGWLPAQAQA
ncbi:MAG: NAD(P)/FAD-dependent oxidoreductase [Chrysiogenetes bacterium]|nr:NAD(P)/FAD-dependent oxidoreductase [Chrysiogenetes bacterium]